MICSIHQPNYIPYTGLFQKIYQSDIFVFYDTVQYTKWDFHNRNKIKWPNGEILLTIPVHVSLGSKINEVHFNKKILQKHLKTIEQSYKKSPYFEEIFSLLSDIYSYDTDKLSDFNIYTIEKISEYLGFNTQFYTLSELDVNLQTVSTQALVDICKFLWVKKYISWAGWRDYIEVSKFRDADIGLEFQQFDNTPYAQLWWDFIPYMSMVDLLFNEWKSSIEFLK